MAQTKGINTSQISEAETDKIADSTSTGGWIGGGVGLAGGLIALGSMTAASGAAVGAAMGTVVPLVGTIIGAILGIVVGGLIGLSQATSITEENVDRAIYQIDRSNLKVTDDFIEKVKRCRANSRKFYRTRIKVYRRLRSY